MRVSIPLAKVALRWGVRRLSIHHPRLLKRWLAGKPFPDVILVELTNDCNQSCPFCAREVMTRSVGYMESETFRSIVDQAAAQPHALMRVVGLGEASMHPEFRECIAYASAKGLPIEITSNGKIFEVMSPAEILGSSIISLSISIDGFGDGSYEKLRPGGNYPQLRRHIESFYAAKRVSKSGMVFTLRNVLLDKTEEKKAQQAARFRSEWAGLSDRVSFNDYVTSRKMVRNETSNRVCDDIMFNLHIEWDGSTPLCTYQHLICKQEDTGNVGEASIAQIWQTGRRAEVRNAHLNRDLGAAEFCKSCPKTRAKAVYRNGSKHNTNASFAFNMAERLVWRAIARK